MCSTTLMEASPSDELPRPPHFLLNNINNNNNNNVSKPLVVGMAPASPDDSAAGDDRVAPLSPGSPGARSAREDDDDEISVGCPSPQAQVRDDTMSEDDEEYLQRQRHYRSGSSSPEPRHEDDYFKPLKKLKMMQINKQRKLRRQSASPPALSLPIPVPAPAAPAPPPPAFDSEPTPTSGASPTGVKSFSIMDILNHRPRPAHSLSPVPPAAANVPVTPSALHRVDAAHAVGLMLQSPAMLAAAASAAASRIVRPWDFGGMLDPAIMMERLHQQQQTLRRHQQHVQHVQQQHLHLQQQAAAHHQAQQALQLSRPQSADLSSSACSSGRSSTASDCCSPSPDVRRQQQQQQQGKDGNSPLDALFQMTSKTFDGLNGEQAAEGSGSHLNLFNSRQQPKKKRKSRTAFTNHQIFELEKRFLYQKYLSPADRDEIAAGLGLSNAQVITWFQNRRAKLKRDMEELKKDVESAKVLTAHKSFLEKVHSLGVLKKKAQPQEKSPVPEK